MINKISEIVGNGHPDKVADEISNIVATSYKHAGIEVLVRANNLKNEINVAVFGDVSGKLRDWQYLIKNYILDVAEYYVKQQPTINLKTSIQSQNSELDNRAGANKSGDQEIIFYTKNKLHEKLKEIKNIVDNECPFWDWKLLVDDVNKNINISYSKTFDTNYSKHNTGYIINCYEYFLKILAEHFPLRKYNITTTAFSGGSFYNDVGVTGRKIIADADGCGAPHGGGAFSGKDKTKAAVAGRAFLIENNTQGAAIYIPNQELDKPTIIKYEK